jgi:hypothetical protein
MKNTELTLLVIAGLVVAAVLLRGRLGGSASGGRAGTGEAANPNAEVIKRLKAVGSDLSKEHQIEFFLYFPAEQAAQAAGAEMAAEGFQIEVGLAPEGSRLEWHCLATKAIVPTTAQLDGISARLEMLAAKYAGEYDGWGAGVV